MFRFLNFSLDITSFWIGFLVASVLWWLSGQIRPLLAQMKTSRRERKAKASMRGSSNVETHHRQRVLRQAQGMHLAAPLFSLEEVLIEPRLIAPPQRIQPGDALYIDDLIGLTIPYTPSRPEFATLYQAASLTIPEALSGGSHLVITGHPGIGKTVALAHLATIAANRDSQMEELSGAIPFLMHVADLGLPLKNANDVLAPIIDIASDNASVFDAARLPSFTKAAFQSGRALLILDGLDEIPPDDLKAAVAYLEKLLELYPKCRIVTSGCPEYLDGLLKLGFAPLALMTWNIPQQERFLEKWGNLWERYVSVEAWAQSGPEQIDSLLLNTWLAEDNANLTPLELTLKTWGAYAGDTRGDSPLDAIETHLRRLSPADIPVAALEAVALQVSLTSQPIFDARTARAWVKSFEPPEEIQSEDSDGKKGKIAAPSQSLLSKMSKSGLLVNHRDNRMRFLHTVFFGFLAGRALSNYQADEQLLQQPNWSGKWLSMQYLAAKGDATNIVDALLKKRDPLLERSLLAMARWLRDAPKKSSWRGKVLTKLASTLQNDSLPIALRGQIIIALAMSGDAGVASLFRQLLNANSVYLVQLAALGSGLIRDKKAIDDLASVFQRVQNTYAWSAACLALVAIGSNRALETVATALLQGDENLRRSAAESLANDPVEGWAMLRDGLTMDDVLIRRSVAYGLARLEQPWAIELLEQVQINDDEWVVRNIASELLERRQQPNLRIPHKLTPPSETPWLISFAGEHGTGIAPGAPATDILIKALKSENEDEQLAALPYLRLTPTEGVLKGMYDAMFGSTIEVREAIYQTLTEIGATGVALPDPQAFGFG